MYLILSIGPLFGLIAMSRLVFKKELSAKV
jgi:hypothetical protein